MKKATQWFCAWMLSIMAVIGANAGPVEGAVTKQPLVGAEMEAQQRLLHELTTLPNKARISFINFRSADSNITISYYLFPPLDFDKAKKYPLVLSLHHEGAEKNYADLLIENPPGYAYGIGRFISAATQEKHPSYLLVPWGCRAHWESGEWTKITPQTKAPTENMRGVIELVDKLKMDPTIDAKRIYVTGQGMGAFGAWDIILRRPDLFAAAIPIGGGGDPMGVFKIREMPIWAFHGVEDTRIPVERTRVMIRNLIKTGGHPRYWEYEKADRLQAAERAYTEPELMDWLFKQSKP